MKEALNVARTGIANAYKTTKQIVPLLASDSTAVIGASMRASSTQELMVAAGYLQKDIDFCKDKPEYTDVSAHASQNFKTK